MSPLALIAAAAVAVNLELSDRSELRIRDMGDAVGTTIDVETAPAGTLTIRARGFEIALDASPRLTLRELDLTPRPSAFLRGGLRVVRRTPRATIEVLGDASYGTEIYGAQSYGALADARSATIQRIPATSAINYLGGRGVLGLRYSMTRRLALGARFSYLWSGGADDASRASVPFQWGPDLTLDAGLALTRTDRLETTLDLSRARFYSGPQSNQLSLGERLRHALSRTTDLTIGGGAAASLSRIGVDEPLKFRVFPLAEAAIAHRDPSDRLTVRIEIGLLPVTDRLSGKVDERVQAAGSLGLRLHPRAEILAGIGTSRSLAYDDGGVALLSGQVALAIRATSRIRVELGTRSAWQWQQGTTGPLPMWAAYTSATCALPSIRF
ncbi:MAG: hypothetical protein U0359_07310 [Byssovorax sp.]